MSANKRGTDAPTIALTFPILTVAIFTCAFHLQNTTMIKTKTETVKSQKCQKAANLILQRRMFHTNS